MILLVSIVLSFALLIVVVWLLLAPQKSESAPAIEALEVEKLLPLHCRHFPLMNQVLQKEDREFMRRRASAELQRQWRTNRSQILRQYLNGLAQDFARLERLARLIAALSPEITRRQEWEWFWLGIQFRALYRMLALRIAIGKISPERFAHLTDLVAGMAGQLESRMSRLTEVLPSRLGDDFGI